MAAKKKRRTSITLDFEALLVAVEQGGLKDEFIDHRLLEKQARVLKRVLRRGVKKGTICAFPKGDKSCQKEKP